MIPRADIQAWAQHRPWPTLAAVEQDLLLARLIVAIYRHPVLGQELVFRGGTCLHHVLMAHPRRYSEDLDFVRRTHSGVGPLLDALREVATEVGIHVAGTQIGTHPKIRLRAPSEIDATVPLRIKIELNTHETSPALPTATRPFQVHSRWFSGNADVLTFQLPELFATKIRALYQRNKGRDLFDLWLALTELRLTGTDILSAFGPYKPAGMNAAAAEANLRAKLNDSSFRTDLAPLVGEWPPDYDIDTAAELVISEILSLLG